MISLLSIVPLNTLFDLSGIGKRLINVGFYVVETYIL